MDWALLKTWPLVQCLERSDVQSLIPLVEYLPWRSCSGIWSKLWWGQYQLWAWLGCRAGQQSHPSSCYRRSRKFLQCHLTQTFLHAMELLPESVCWLEARTEEFGVCRGPRAWDLHGDGGNIKYIIWACKFLGLHSLPEPGCLEAEGAVRRSISSPDGCRGRLFGVNLSSSAAFLKLGTSFPAVRINLCFLSRWQLHWPENGIVYWAGELPLTLVILVKKNRQTKFLLIFIKTVQSKLICLTWFLVSC